MIEKDVKKNKTSPKAAIRLATFFKVVSII